MHFNQLLIEKQIDPKDVLIFRHRPWEPTLRSALPWLAAEKPDLFNAYQSAQWPRVEKAMTKAKYIGSFIGHEAGKALFIGVYDVGKSRPISHKSFWKIPQNQELKLLGMTGMTADRHSTLSFELTLRDFYSDWKGKLVVQWPGLERSWWRWADRNVLLVDSISEESLLYKKVQDWRELTFTWEELVALPKNWREKISEWRAIYFIWDSAKREGYVGSAYGTENLLTRWKNYAATGHGGNQKLRKSKPSDLRFSILERVSPDMMPEEVIRLENTWKNRLHTRTSGLNEN